MKSIYVIAAAFCVAGAAFADNDVAKTVTDPAEILSGEFSADSTGGDTGEGYAHGIRSSVGLEAGVGADVTVNAKAHYTPYYASAASSGNYGATGIYLSGTAGNIGSIAAAVNVEAPVKGAVKGIFFSSASQAEGAGITSNITANAANGSSYGVSLYNSTVGNIGTGASVIEVNADAGWSFAIQLYQNSHAGNIGGKISAYSASGMAAGIYFEGMTTSVNSIGDILADAHITAKTDGASAAYAINGSTMNAAIGTIYGRLEAEAAGTAGAYGISIGGGNSANPKEIKLGGDAYVSAKAADPANAYAVRFSSADGTISGDSSTQTLIGNFRGARSLTFGAGNFILDNFGSTTSITSGAGFDVILADDASVTLAKSALITGGNFDFQGEINLVAGSLDDFSNLTLAGSTNMLIGGDASVNFILDSAFSASAGDIMEFIILDSGTITGSLDNFELHFKDSSVVDSSLYKLVVSEDGKSVSVNFLGDVHNVPEPAAFAVLFGAAAIAFASCRRRR